MTMKGKPLQSMLTGLALGIATLTPQKSFAELLLLGKPAYTTSAGSQYSQKQLEELVNPSLNATSQQPLTSTDPAYLANRTRVYADARGLSIQPVAVNAFVMNPNGSYTWFGSQKFGEQSELPAGTASIDLQIGQVAPNGVNGSTPVLQSGSPIVLTLTYGNNAIQIQPTNKTVQRNDYPVVTPTAELTALNEKPEISISVTEQSGQPKSIILELNPVEGLPNTLYHSSDLRNWTSAGTYTANQTLTPSLNPQAPSFYQLQVETTIPPK